MKLRRSVQWLVVIVALVVGVVALVPSWRDVVVGYARNEKTYRGMPTSYWAKKITDREADTYKANQATLTDPAAIPVLNEALGDQDPTVRLRSAEVLGTIGGPAIPTVVKALHDENRLIRFAAARSLVKMGKDAKDALPDLIDALKDPEFLVQQMVVTTIGKIGPDARPAIPPLIAFIKEHMDPRINGNVADVLVNIGPKDAAVLEFFNEGLKDEDQVFRQIMADRLRKLGIKPAKPDGADDDEPAKDNADGDKPVPEKKEKSDPPKSKAKPDKPAEAKPTETKAKDEKN
jgi:HEAT repeat protein